MPQIIFNSHNKEKIKTFIKDIKEMDITLLSWDNIFEFIEKSSLYPKNIFYIVDINGKIRSYKSIHKQKLNLWDYVMYNTVTNERNNDFYISFGIHLHSIKN